MRYTNVLHLSDLHLKSDEAGRFNQSVVIDGLEADLRTIRDTHLRPDCLVFSGDIVQAADDEECFDEAALVLSELANAAGIPESRVFICPGNHDVSRSVIGQAIPNIKNFRSDVLSVERMNSLSLDMTFIDHIGKSFSKFSKLQKSFGGDYLTYSDSFLSQFFVRDLKLSIICINTATLSGAGLSTDVLDERNLVFPEMSLVKAIRRVPEGAQVVVVGHHPLPHLSEFTESILRPIFQKDVDLYLSGHLHAAAPHSVFSPSGVCTFAQSGSLYASRDWWNGYSVVSVVPGSTHHRITYRKWHEQRREFGVASDLSDDGVIYSTPEAVAFWSSITPKINFRSLEAWRIDQLNSFLTDEFGPDFKAMCSNGTFVQPEFEKDTYVETANGLEKASRPETIQMSALIDNTDNIVIGAREESGKTTLIRYWAWKLASTPVSHPGWSCPVILRFTELRNYVKSIENLIRQRLPTLPTSITAFDLLEAGMITIFVDDIDLKSSPVKSAFDTFVQKYPNCRYVLLTGSIYLQGAGIVPVVVPDIPFTHVRLKQLKTSQLLTLIESHGTKDPTQADRLLQRMVQEASSLNVPITPVTGTFLIQIYTEDSSKPLINRANLIERYVEISLEKFAPEELLPSSFDFHNKSDLLSFVAERMCTSETYEIAEIEFINLISEYMSEYGLPFSSIDLIEYFVRAKILSRSSGFISFRLNAFMEYFAALRMTNQPTFRDYVLAEERYLSFSNEITFYAAISRKDSAWLNNLYGRFKKRSETVWINMPNDVQSGTLLETFVGTDKHSEESEVFDVERRIFDEPLAESERRSALDGELPISSLQANKYERRLLDDPGSEWLAQLTLLSAMLKNMELVPSNLKKEILSDVIQGWLQFLALSMGMVPTLAKEKRMNFAGIEYIVLFPDDFEIGEVARRLFMYLPISTAKVAAHHLGTEKLRLQLEEGIGNPVEEVSASQQFFRAAILAQLGVDGLGQIIDRVAGNLEDKRFLNAVFVRMLAEVVVRFRLPDQDLRQIRATAAEIMTQLEGKTGRQAAIRKGKLIESFASSRLKIEYGTPKIKSQQLKR